MAGCEWGPPAFDADLSRWALLAGVARRRLAFEDRPGTEVILAVIVGWYLIQLGTLATGWETDRALWLFTTESFPQLSPGLFLAVISHAFPPNVTHLPGNAAFLWLFAGESEQHMHTSEVLAIFVVAGLCSVTISTALTGTNTLGASGSVLAFVGFLGAHLVVGHWGDLELHGGKYGTVDPRALRAYWQAAVLLLPIGVGVITVLQFGGVVEAGRTDVIGHLVGLICGVGYGIARAWWS
ncbi:rhomboid family intramembrane serine protease [Halomicroarcula sp. GCM10025709]|uniref:rhomboid family intramembrane serine protease n=1 Tax=Haloarcula TaxID=2237 RepID=UPI0024C26794|nr:rhomboid family intramembrane serine protease [Halomicroarcula sp. YJ-61-S]